jgi:hypothetical protein
MSFRRFVLVLGVVAVASLSVLAGGCKPAGKALVSFWPKADSERVVPKPAEPTRWPLTGLDAPSEASVQIRAVSIKIETSPAARPQTNLQLADVVYESVTEGGITRFNAIYHSQNPDEVGPVRSARLSDLYIVPQYHALFVFSGASSTVNAKVNKSGIENLSEDAGITYPFFRSKEHPMPHNLFVILSKVREEASKRKMPSTETVQGFSFDRKVVETTSTITQLSIPFSQANHVSWTYDSASRTYLRTNDGKIHKDAATGKQLSARNVVVIWAKHTVASRDKVGSTTYEIVLDGKGKASVFSNGQRYDGTWETDGSAPPTFKMSDGTPIELAPGNTWIQVVQPSVNITMK